MEEDEVIGTDGQDPVDDIDDDPVAVALADKPEALAAYQAILAEKAAKDALKQKANDNAKKLRLKETATAKELAEAKRKLREFEEKDLSNEAKTAAELKRAQEEKAAIEKEVADARAEVAKNKLESAIYAAKIDTAHLKAAKAYIKAEQEDNPDLDLEDIIATMKKDGSVRHWFLDAAPPAPSKQPLQNQQQQAFRAAANSGKPAPAAPGVRVPQDQKPAPVGRKSGSVKERQEHVAAMRARGIRLPYN